MTDYYDYIIGGGGCSGMSLALELHDAGLQGKRVLVIDQNPKPNRLFTWCFWETGKSRWDDITRKQWERVELIDTEGNPVVTSISPYRYKFIQSKDFFSHCQQIITENPAFDMLADTITGVSEKNGAVIVSCKEKNYHCQLFFDSTSVLVKKDKTHGNKQVIQQFFGYFIQTQEPCFDPGKATLMDFRVEQEPYVRFVYTMPFDTCNALVEITSFSPQLQGFDGMSDQLRRFIEDTLNIHAYQIMDQERGVIPMNKTYKRSLHAKQIIPIGKYGGCLKPSTGYAFSCIQKQAVAITKELMAGKTCFKPRKKALRYLFYDQVMLEVLTSSKQRVPDRYMDFFTRNPGYLFLRFLNEETTLWEELLIMNRSKQSTFIAALFRVLRRFIWRW